MVRGVERDDSVGVLGVVVEHVARRQPIERLGAEQPLELVTAILAMQPDRADDGDVGRPHAAPGELVEQDRQRHATVRRGVSTALHPVGDGDRDDRPRRHQFRDRRHAERGTDRRPRRRGRVGERGRFDVAEIRADDDSGVGQLGVDSAVAVRQADPSSHRKPAVRTGVHIACIMTSCQARAPMDEHADDVAVIGVGRMGAAAVRSLAASGRRVRCFDVSSVAMDSLTDIATPCDTVADATRGVALVLLSLRGPADVVEVTGQLRGTVPAGGVVADLSTIDPDTARSSPRASRTTGSITSTLPVLGRPERAGAWTIACGGDGAAVLRVAPILESSIAGRVAHVGPVGAGSVLKLMNNLMLGAINAITAEALAVCSAAGLDPGVFVDVVADSGAASVSPMFRDIANKIVAGDFTPTFTVELMHKDNELAVTLAEQVGVPLVVGEAVHRLNTRALDRYRRPGLRRRRETLRGSRRACPPAADERAGRRQ